MKIKYLITIILLINVCYATETPKNWPWRGVNIPFDILKYEHSIILELSQKDVNAIRIHVDYKKYMKKHNYSYDQAINASIIELNELLDEIKKYNMTAFIGTENFPYKNKTCADKLNKTYWDTSECISNMYEIANKYSKSFSNRDSELTGYQFMSEAIYMDKEKSILPENWSIIQEELLKIVRKYDRKHFFIYSPTLWALTDNFDNVKLLNDKKIIYNAHYFFPYNYTHQGIKKNEFNITYPSFINFRYWDKSLLEKKLKSFINFGKENNVPILIGSFSKMNWIKDDNRWLRDILNVFEENQISWLYFIVGEQPWKGWNPRYIGDYKNNLFHKNEKNKTWEILKKYFKLNNKDNDEN